MKRIVLFFFVSVTFFSRAQDASIKEAVDLLNAIRANPSAYSKMVGVSLTGISKLPALHWNDTLAKVAQAKAMDLAQNNYFGHVDKKGYGLNYYVNKAGYKLPESWLKDKKSNYCESLAAGSATPKDGIIQLLNDGGIKDHVKAGHRVHLLGIGDFHNENVDIGIGWVTLPGSTYENYMVVVITRHTF